MLEKCSNEEEGQEEDVPEQDSTCLSREHLDDVDLLFADEIVKNAKISFKDVRNDMSESLNLFMFADQQALVKKVYRRIKYLQTLSRTHNKLPFSGLNSTTHARPPLYLWSSQKNSNTAPTVYFNWESG